MTTCLVTVPVDRIRVGAQVRRHFDDSALNGLAASIAESGLQQPLLCRTEGDGYLLIDGERRLRACKLLGWKDVVVLAAADQLSAVQVLTQQLACNLQREDLSAVERAQAIRSLMQQASMTAEQIAKKLGQSPATISRTLSVLKLPEPLQVKVAAGDISADAAYLLTRIAEPDRQARFADDVLSGRLTRDALSRKLKRLRRSDESSASGPTRVTAILGSGRSVTLAGKGLSFDSMIDWLEQLLVRARKSKAQGLTLETFVRALRDQSAERKGATP